MTQSKTKKLTDVLKGQTPKIVPLETFTETPSKTSMRANSNMITLEQIDQKPEEYMRHIREFVANPVGFFLISGTNGNGKTFTARAIFNKFWHPHSDNKFWNQADLKMKWQSTYAEYGSTDYFFNELANAPLLVLDDIGTTKPTEAFLEFLYALANKREVLKHTHGTIITTNLNSKSMKEILGGAFVSRVACGRCIRHDGPDRRPDLF